jgi:DNA-directed RNA polymerase subunit RPC12/RpoP
MSNFCPQCGNKIEGNPNFCPECGHTLIKKILEKKMETEVIPKTGEIKCQYCGKLFALPTNWTGEIKAQKTTSTSGNIARGVVFLPWGIVSAVKNKKFIQCPHCKMKIMQG